MTIALICNKNKQTLLLNFAKAYHSVLSKHKIISTGNVAALVEKSIPIKVTKLNALQDDSNELILPKIANSEIDMLIFFRGDGFHSKIDSDILLMCDRYNILYATNSASAEILIKSLII